MIEPFSDHELEAYLDEALPAADMARFESAVRQTPELLRRLAEVIGRREAGAHSVGEIWRRHRLSCPGRIELGGFLLGTLSKDAVEYVKFHVELIGCRYCSANLDDLRQQRREASTDRATRRTRYFQSSAGYLDRKRER